MFLTSLIITFFFSLLIFLTSPSFIVSRSIPQPAATKLAITENVQSLANAGIGSKIEGISQFKRYLSRFGYLQNNTTEFNDEFDSMFELALIRYQRNLALQVTGKLDSKTVSQMVTPRCGVPDSNAFFHHNKLTHSPRQRFVYFPGKPRWSSDSRAVPMTLTYAFSPEYVIHTLSTREIRDTFRRAFARWASVIPVRFEEVEEFGYAEIRIGFYSGDHGDGEPFDGVLGVLAHSFSPEIGRLHLDAAETWAVDFGVTESEVAVDLESVATHEIGHVLGLSHSSVKEAVMYPSLRPREKRADLNMDDIKGVQSLYGSNPHFRSEWSSLESDMSANHGANHFGVKLHWTWKLAFIIMIHNLIHL